MLGGGWGVRPATLWRAPEGDKVAMSWASGGSGQDLLVAGLVKVLADDLARRLLAGGRERGGARLSWMG